MSFDARLYPVATDANYTVGPASTVEDIDGFLLPVSTSLAKEGGADGYLRTERLFLDPVAPTGTFTSGSPLTGEVRTVGFAPAVSVAPPGIAYVGGVKGSTAGTLSTWSVSFADALTGGTNTTPQPGDMVVVFYAIGSDTTRFPVPSLVTAGYTAGTQLTTGSAFTIQSNYFYKVLGDTPDTSVTLSATGDVADAGAVAVRVYRGVDLTTPFDGVTPVTMTGTGTGAGQNKPNPGPITPTTTGAWILALGAQAVGTSVDFTAPAELDSATFQSQIQGDTNDAAIGAGHYTGWTSGIYDVGIFGGGVSNANNAQTAYTLVLKPAPTSGDVTATPTAGAVSIAGFAPTVATGGGVSVTPDLGAVAVAGLAPTTAAAVTASPTLGAVTVTGLAPSASAAVAATTAVGAVTVSGIAPTTSAAATATPAVGAVTVTGFAPTVTVGGGVTATPSVGVVTVTGFASFAAAAASLAPSVGVVTVAGFAPTAVTGGAVSVTPDLGAVSIGGFEPSVNTGQPIVRVFADDGGEVLKKHVRSKAYAQLKDALEDIREAPKKQRADAAERALEALEPIAAVVDHGEALRAVAAISAALERVTIQRDGYLAAVQRAEAELARLEAIQAKIRKRRRDEAALLLLM